MAIAEPQPYAARLDVDYSETLDRVTTAFRIILIIPIAIVAALLAGGFRGDFSGTGDGQTAAVGGAGLFLPTLLLLVFRRKYPRWWFDFSRELARFSARVGSYLFLLTDQYPSTTDEQAAKVEIDYPEAEQLNRWLPLVKWLLAIPHYIVLLFLGIGVIVVTIIAWFAILFTGSYPRGMFNFVVGVFRWGLRVQAYAFLLVTDKYPPFSLD
jgi:hypothetical protein